LVLNIPAGETFGQDSANSLTEYLLTAVQRAERFTVIGMSDVQTILDREKARAAFEVECDTETCFTQLAGALGATYLVTCSVANVESVRTLSMKLIDSQSTVVVGRFWQRIRDGDDLALFKAVSAGVVEMVRAYDAATQRQGTSGVKERDVHVEPPAVREAPPPAQEEVAREVSEPPVESPRSAPVEPPPPALVEPPAGPRAAEVTTVSAPPPQEADSSSFPWWWIVAGGVVALGGVAVGIYFGVSNGSDERELTFRW
jgi:TolB-like protein